MPVNFSSEAERLRSNSFTSDLANEELIGFFYFKPDGFTTNSQTPHEDQLNQAARLNLVANSVAVWNTVYLQAALEQLKCKGYEINEDHVKHLSPARSKHINIYGKYYFNIKEGFK